MATAPTFTKTGAKASSNATLPKAVFGVEAANHSLLKQAYLAHRSNDRSGTAQVLNRAQVRGGGRKPWHQKGLGRARVGSIRSPIWRGGGVTFGPTGTENYKSKLNKTAKRKAITQALSLKAAAKAIVVIEDFTAKDGKTKAAAATLAKVAVNGSVLIVVTDKTAELDRAVCNLSNATLVQAKYLNVADILDTDAVLITKPALKELESWLGVSS